MPRIFPTFAAMVIIGVCIAFNTARYPIVWEMTGPDAKISSAEKSSSPAEDAPSAKTDSLMKADSSAKAVSSVAAAPLASPSPDISSKAEDAIENKKPSLPKAEPIPLPKEEIAGTEEKQPAETEEKHIAEKVDQNKTRDLLEETENSAESLRPLVPVANSRLEAGQPEDSPNNIRRLPPIEAVVAYPAERYAAEYPGEVIPIYPSTGQ
jgi:hypothetical protein